MSELAIRIDDNLEAASTKLFKELGLDMSTAVRLFLATSVKNQTLPFPIDNSDDYLSLAMEKIPTVRVSVSDQESLGDFFGDEDFSEYGEVFG